jgi:hypothetical protein
LVPQGTGTTRSMPWTFDLGTGGYQYCGVEWQAGNGSILNGATKISFRAKADKKTVVDFHLLQSDIGDDNYFGVLDTLTTEWKTFEHTFSKFRGRLSNREGQPNLTKGTGLRWHVQFDKNPGLTTGTITLDDFKLGGNLTSMYAAPEAAQARTGTPPPLDIKAPGIRPKPRLKTRSWRRSQSLQMLHNSQFYGISGKTEGRLVQ